MSSIRIIDNKKLSMTESEFQMYKSICRSYDRPSFKGEEMFKDLFESDENGIIICLVPPKTSYSSMEIWLFLSALFQQQHMRLIYAEATGVINEAKAQLAEILKLRASLEEKK